MKRKIIGAVKNIESFVAINMPPTQLQRVLVRIIKEEDWAHRNLADEIAEEWLATFSSELQKRAEYERQRSKVSVFEFNSVSEQHIQGSCFIEPRNSPQERESKIKRANCVHIAEILKETTDDQFEELCANILELWHVESPIRTQRNADHGIDFFGKMTFRQFFGDSQISSGAEKQFKIWFVGQAKNYSASAVSTTEIREFVGSVDLARSKNFATLCDPLPELQIRAYDPVCYLFFTTGSFSEHAVRLLRRSGVVAMDGDQLATFLADRGIGIKRGRFDKAAFEKWAYRD